MQKFFLRTAAVLLIVTGLFTTAIVGAAVQTFDGQGQWQSVEGLDDESLQLIAMERALQDAQHNARQKVIEQLKNHSAAMKAMITETEINAVAQNVLEIVGEVHYDKKKVSFGAKNPIVLYTAKVKTKIDLNAVAEFIKRDDRDKATIVEQNEQLQDVIAKNKEHAKALVEQYKRATTQAEKDRIREEMKQAVYDFTANRKLEEGNRLYYAKKFDDAIKLYIEAIELKPDGAETYNNRGVAYQELQQYDRAIADFNKALEFKQHEFIYNNRAIAYIRLGKYDRAIEDYDKAIELKPDYALSYNNRGITYNDLGQHDRAIENFNRAIELKPNYAEYYYNRGVVYENLGQHERAIADYSKAIDFNPNLHQVYTNRGVVYANLKQFECAIKDFNRALYLKQHEFIYINLGSAYFYLGQYDRAIKNYNRALDLKPDYAKAYYNRGLAYAYLGQHKRAIADYTKAIELNPNYVDAYNNRGNAYFNLEQYDRAISDFDKALELNPNNTVAKNNRERCLEAMGK